MRAHTDHLSSLVKLGPGGSNAPGFFFRLGQ